MLAKIRILFWMGVLLLFVPFIGITSTMRTILTIILGALTIWLSFRIRKNYKELRYKLRRLEEPLHTPELHTDTH